VLRKLSEFLCSTNVGPVFFPIDRPATGAGSKYGRYLGKSLQFRSANRRPPEITEKFFSKTVSVRIPAQCRRQLLQWIIFATQFEANVALEISGECF